MKDTEKRREEILETLRGGAVVPARELAERFGVTRKTIAADVAVISRNYPIESLPGKNGGYRYEGQMRLALNDKERQYLLDKITTHQEEFPPHIYESLVRKFGEEDGFH